MRFKKGTLYLACGLFALAGVALVAKSLISSQLNQPSPESSVSPVKNASLTTIKPALPEGTLLALNTSEVKHCQDSISLDEEALLSLPQKTFKTHHTWSKDAEVFTGPLLLDVLNLACRNVDKLKLTALNDYSIEMDFTKLRSYQPIIAHSVNGKRLSVRDKGPLWIMIPLDQHSEISDRSLDDMLIWQLSDITILSSYEAS